MLHLPPLSTAHALAYTHRFKKSKHAEPFTEIDTMLLATTTMFLACKVTEQPRRLSDVIGTGYRILHPTHAPLDLDEGYYSLRSSVVTTELILVRLLEFDLECSLPFSKVQRLLSHMDLGHGILESQITALLMECIKSPRIYNYYDSTVIALSATYVGLQMSSLDVGPAQEWTTKMLTQGALGRRRRSEGGIPGDVTECINDMSDLLRANMEQLQ